MEEDVYSRELYMLTGVVNKDRSYLYYLLIKDGNYFKTNSQKEPEVIKTESTVESLQDWFDKI